ncbi:MAG: glycerol-3-phosphate 1-O-acyltransferase PlsY [Flavobacteriales bacterium]|nr:glycerol-3-phosphate 1-O-acyltransferase PlsY [Flavobacteriales bacterium]
MIILFSILSYLLGSLPSSVWISRAFYGIDIREHGSGNAGATNTFRVLGSKTGIIVLTLDVLKGITASSLVMFLGSISHGTDRYINIQLLFGLCAVLGHLFPIYENFKGGKGIATLFGMVIGINYALALACVALFLTVLILTRYVSLSSILATISFPVFAIFIFKRDEPLLIAFGIVSIIIVILTHQKNIKKLLEGEENKTYLFKRKH